MFNLVEEFPSVRATHVLKLGAIATLVVLFIIAGYVFLNPPPTEPQGELLDIKLYIPPTQPVEARGGVVLASATQPRTTLLVLTPVRIRNTSDEPFSIFDISGVVRLGNAEYDSEDASTEDFQKVFRYYPDLIAYQQQPLLRHSVIRPGETLQGMLIFNYPLTDDQWNMRTSFQVKTSFDHGQEIVLAGTDTPENWPRLNAEAQ